MRMSLKKASFLKGGSRRGLRGYVYFEELVKMTDQKLLIVNFVAWIGVWTAEMLMIFSLEGPNI